MNRAFALGAALCACVLLTDTALAAPPQLGLNCTVSGGSIAFDPYNPVSANGTSGSGIINYRCTLGLLIRINLDGGTANSVAARKMQGPNGSMLSYNLYQDLLHLIVWGDGTNGTASYTDVVAALVTNHVPIYGYIPSRQNASGGDHSDSVLMTIVF